MEERATACTLSSLARRNVTLSVRRLHPANPVLSPKEAWEASYIQAYGNVLYDADQQLFRMWYSARYEPSPGVKYNTVCQAVSTDGLNWERSKLDRLKHEGLRLSNAVLKGFYIGPTVLHTPWDPDPGCRYRMFVYTGVQALDDIHTGPGFDMAYGVFFSPDGIIWTEYEHNPVLQGGDIATCCYDPVTQDYVAFPKVHRTDDSCYRRCVGVSASKDFLRWGAPHLILSGDTIDDARVDERLRRFRDILLYRDPSYQHAEMYGMTGFRYEGLRLGLIWFCDVSARRGTLQETGGNGRAGFPPDQGQIPAGQLLSAQGGGLRKRMGSHLRHAQPAEIVQEWEGNVGLTVRNHA